MSKRIQPFFCGSQFDDWEATNCDRCTKGTPSEMGKWPTCDIQAALVQTSLDDGTVSQEIADRMGYEAGPPFRYCWPCTEVEWTVQWQAEFLARKEAAQ